MTPEQIFSAANTTALLGWILLVFGPRWRWSRWVVQGFLPGLLLAALYVVLLGTHWGESAGGFSTLADVAKLFANPWVLLAGWVHYLAFDLFVGAWEVRDAQRRGISHWLVIPCLILTFLLGPAGFLLYFLIRSFRSRSPLELPE